MRICRQQCGAQLRRAALPPLVDGRRADATLLGDERVGPFVDRPGRRREPTNRLEHIARLAWRTIPHAFAREGRAAPGPTAFRLTSPSGEPWTFEPDGDVVNVIEGDGVELCEVASRRVPASATSLRASGPDAATILDLVRTWA